MTLADIGSIVTWFKIASGASTFYDARVHAYWGKFVIDALGQFVQAIALQAALAPLKGYKPRNKNPPTFKLCFICPNGSSTFACEVYKFFGNAVLHIELPVLALVLHDANELSFVLSCSWYNH